MIVSRTSTIYATQRAMTERRDLLKRSFKLTLYTAAFVALPFVADKFERSHYHEDAFFKGRMETRVDVSLAELKRIEQKGERLIGQVGQDLRDIRKQILQPLQSTEQTELDNELQELTDASNQGRPKTKVLQQSKVSQNNIQTQKAPEVSEAAFYPSTPAESIVSQYPRFSEEVTAVTLGEAFLALSGITLAAKLLMNSTHLANLRRTRRRMQAEARIPFQHPVSVKINPDSPLGDPKQYKRQFRTD